MKIFSHDQNYFSRTEMKKYALACFSNLTVRSLHNHDDDGNKNVTNFHIW